MSAHSLYAHVPFCASICAYCDFPKLIYSDEWAFSYIDEVLKELKERGAAPGSFRTVYVGGGTPTSLPAPLLKRLLLGLRPYLAEGPYEWTVEANPESATAEKLRVMHEVGVNRISFGVESSSPRLLSMMGREHTFQEAVEAIKRAREAGFTNINADMIYALPGETLDEVRDDVEAFLSLHVPHLSAYSLIVGEGTRFHNDGVKEAGDATQADQYELILKALREAGYDRYEVSNFAIPGYQSEHNLTYWRDEEYLGVGLGAAGYLDGVRYSNTRSITSYLKGAREAEREKVDDRSALEYYFTTNLRLEEGFSLEDFEARFGFPFMSRYGEKADGLVRRGLLDVSGGRVRPTDQGILLLDMILLELFD